SVSCATPTDKNALCAIARRTIAMRRVDVTVENARDQVGRLTEGKIQPQQRRWWDQPIVKETAGKGGQPHLPALTDAHLAIAQTAGLRRNQIDAKAVAGCFGLTDAAHL